MVSEITICQLVFSTYLINCKYRQGIDIYTECLYTLVSSSRFTSNIVGTIHSNSTTGEVVHVADISQFSGIFALDKNKNEIGNIQVRGDISGSERRCPILG